MFVIISGTIIPPFFKSEFITYPDNYENFLTKILPNFLKKRITRWFLLHNKILVKNFNYIARKYNVKSFKTFNDILLGDHNFICDDINFIGVKPTEEFPKVNYIGPILNLDIRQELDIKLEDEIINHLKRPGKSILFSMGSSGDRELFLKILDILNNTDYNVIAICTNRFDIKDLPKLNNNILLVQYVKSAFMLNKLVDLAIIHGGRGTVYISAISGKPAIGIPMQIEQQFNIDNLVRNGTAIRVKMKYFTSKELLDSINIIFNNYEKYLLNAQKLAKNISYELAEENATKLLIDIMSKYKKEKSN
jgi:UDP:flavonoid glycosyltransferase YjiC (YdhE family)